MIKLLHVVAMPQKWQAYIQCGYANRKRSVHDDPIAQLQGYLF